MFVLVLLITVNHPPIIITCLIMVVLDWAIVIDCWLSVCVMLCDIYTSGVSVTIQCEGQVSLHLIIIACVIGVSYYTGSLYINSYNINSYIGLSSVFVS